MQVDALAAYISDRGWDVTKQIKDIGSGAKDRPGRESLLKAARRREVDVIVVWRLDRWGRSVADLMTTLRELTDLGVGFVSLTEALDLITPTGREMAGLLAIFAEFEREILREWVRAGTAQARKEGRRHGQGHEARAQRGRLPERASSLESGSSPPVRAPDDHDAGLAAGRLQPRRAPDSVRAGKSRSLTFFPTPRFLPWWRAQMSRRSDMRRQSLARVGSECIPLNAPLGAPRRPLR
jgi:predicted site-specific integrase-resolvase